MRLTMVVDLLMMGGQNLGKLKTERLTLHQ